MPLGAKGILPLVSSNPLFLANYSITFPHTFLKMIYYTLLTIFIEILPYIFSTLCVP